MYRYNAGNKIETPFTAPYLEGKIQIGEYYDHYDLMLLGFPDFTIDGPLHLSADAHEVTRVFAFIGRGCFDTESHLVYRSLDKTHLDYDGTCIVQIVGNPDGVEIIDIPSKSPIGDIVTKIRSFAFQGITSLTSVTIPETVIYIGEYAFQGCTSLASITYDGTKAEWESIEKAPSWDRDINSYTVHCTDGDIVKTNS